MYDLQVPRDTVLRRKERTSIPRVNNSVAHASPWTKRGRQPYQVRRVTRGTSHLSQGRTDLVSYSSFMTPVDVLVGLRKTDLPRFYIDWKKKIQLFTSQYPFDSNCLIFRKDL